ncbi:MAG: LON peptidase substrate-binding domain-containing protein [Chloroflexi bacterium]|nr:LON peptidase substrate-binding domain-containing protein [Chloroflexota bacterium]
MPKLPLFPLNTVLFPGGTLPLRIFEPRYKEMLKDCMELDRRFGVVLIKSGVEVGGPADPYMIGTVARITDLGQPVAGAIPLKVVGESRFKIVSLDRSLPYLAGSVEHLEETTDPEAERAAGDFRVAADRYVRLLLASHGEYRGHFDLPADPLELASLAGVLLLDQPPQSRQEVLEADPLSRRLKLAARLLDEAASETSSSLMRTGPGRSPSTFGLN